MNCKKFVERKKFKDDNLDEVLNKVAYNRTAVYIKRICADVIVTNPGGVIPPHRHTIPSALKQNAKPLSPGSSPAAQLGAPLQIKP